jgi:hypothetical protein
VVLTYPTFILFHSGGSGGDFLIATINYLHDKLRLIEISEKGNVITNEAIQNFKYFGNYLKNNHTNIEMPNEILYAMTLHHYSETIKEFYPQSVYYYINYKGHESEVCQRYFSLAFDFNVNRIIDFLKIDNKAIALQDFKKIGESNWKNWLKIFKINNIESIPIDIFFKYELFETTVKEKFLLIPDEYVKLKYIEWQEKNKHFFKKLQEK